MCSIFLLLVIPAVLCSSPSSSVLSDSSDSDNDLAMETIPLNRLCHRHVEHYSAEFLSNLTDSNREIITNQILLDDQNDIYAPAEDDSHGPPQEYTPLGTIELGKIVHTGDQSVLFEIANHPGLLIKYQANCEDLDPELFLLHPLILDYWYMHESFELGLSPEPLFLSPPSLFARLYGVTDDRKFPFTMDVFTAGDCALNDGVVRYMIMRKSRGTDLHNFRRLFRNHIVPMNVAAGITAAIINGLNRLHNAGRIVHGDIHTGNIVVERTLIHGTYRIMFIDFGRAFRDDGNITNDRVNAIGYWNHYLCSPWQIDGRAWGRRDDVYKAIQIFAIITNPGEYTAREEYAIRMKNVPEVVTMKRTRFMFQMAPPVRTNRYDYSSTFDPLSVAAGADTEKRNLLINELEMLQASVTGELDNVNAEIRYTEIIESLNWIVQTISSRRNMTVHINTSTN